ncbi:hypothetical protein [Blastococcus brunescens]|uniref:MmcQ/YjbR family DNA-binding protein n=1 Tax=Blastococcus brunescens TaxID=1564165 RepID=A0ABZ1B777_9ACTN|nr:hypothetical protein [Blastococcus sp. BMG 8361]WRL64885.1 hypothetical protein U6N30_03865 [Blastococcus sp. BMG 8361]
MRGKTFLRERPCTARTSTSSADGLLRAGARGLGTDEGAEAALLAAEPEVHVSTSHVDGWPAVLCRLDRLDEEALTELVEEAWAAHAPRGLVAGHVPRAHS